MNSTPRPKYIDCSYILRDGSVCGKSSITGICGSHTGHTPRTRCTLCGKGTMSVTGFCFTTGPCRNGQTAYHKAMAKERAKTNCVTVSTTKKWANVEPPLSVNGLDILFESSVDIDSLVDRLSLA